MRNIIVLVSICIKYQVCADFSRRRLSLTIPIANCPFMAGSYASLNFDGPMRVDANHAKNPQYAPNSFVDKFRPDTAEAPYKVGDNIVSRKGHFYHEGKPLTEYDQPRELYENVMNDEQRAHLHSNTAVMLSHVSEPIIQSKYLAQLYKINKTYSKAVYDELTEKKFEFSEVEETADGIEKAGHHDRFRPSQTTDRLVGMPASGVYNAVPNGS
jgi:catalase